MGAFTNFAEKKILDFLLQDAAYRSANPLPETLYVALSSTAPTEAGGNITEPTFTGYARQAVEWDLAVMGDPTEAANTNEESFGDPDDDDGASHMVLFDAASGGNAWVIQALGGTVNWQAAVADPLSFPAGQLKLNLD
jgi:hypothetical protein